MTTKQRDEYPGLVAEDAYDDEYPDGVAGHVASGARIDPASDAVMTPFGMDHPFPGPDLVGYEHPNEAETVQDRDTATAQDETAKARSAHVASRKKVSDTADRWNPQTFSLSSANPIGILKANPTRRSVTIYCVSGGPVSVGNQSGISLNGPNTVSIPVGGFRTFMHKTAVLVVGPQGAVIDVSEESYLP